MPDRDRILEAMAPALDGIANGASPEIPSIVVEDAAVDGPVVTGPRRGAGALPAAAGSIRDAVLHARGDRA